MNQVTGKHLLCNMLLIKTRTLLAYGEVNHPVDIHGKEHILTLNFLHLTSIIFRSLLPLACMVKHKFTYNVFGPKYSPLTDLSHCQAHTSCFIL